MSKKILVANMSGNVGKTTIAKYLVADMRPGTSMISVESINSAAGATGTGVVELDASRFREIYYKIMKEDSIVVDVGASNIAEFMAEVAKFRSLIPEFDLVLVPVVPTEKQQLDTIATLEWLQKYGVGPEKIRVVFNRFDTGSMAPVEVQYGTLMQYLDDNKRIAWKPAITIATNEVFESLGNLGSTLAELANDRTDFKALRAQAKVDNNVAALDAAIERSMAHDLASHAHSNLVEAHALIFGTGKGAAAPAPAAARK
jgi:MinD-like ATPase involved in chromosome partitioning or flagellar assembly